MRVCLVILLVAFCAAFCTVAASAQQDVTITLDEWHDGPCDKIPWDGIVEHPSCDGVYAFDFTRDYARLPLSASAQTTSATFLDPGNPDWILTRVRARVHGAPDWSGGLSPCDLSPYAALTMSTSINGQLIAPLFGQQYAGMPMCANPPACGGPALYKCSQFYEIWFDGVTPQGFPGYVHGGQNTFSFTYQLDVPRGDIPSFSLEDVDLILTFSCSVCVDVDNNFVASAPVDDNRTFIPGTTMAGIELPVPAAGQPLQQIKLHVLTPGTKGKKYVVFTLSGVSAWPGVAMNSPLTQAATTPDMAFSNGAQSITLQVPSSHDTVATLNIYDYAARGTVTVTAPTASGSTVTFEKKIPQDNNGNGFPDAGWYLTSGNKVAEASLTSAADVDFDPPGLGEPFDTSIGDGLSNFEEYRGFVFGGSYQRLDPNQKDLVLVADPAILTQPQTLQFLTSTLPFRKRYAELTEVAGEDYPSRQIVKTKPVVNPNRAGVPGARTDGQRGVRIVQQELFPPGVTVNGTSEPIWQVGILGATWVESMPDLDVFNSPANVAAIESPDRTRLVEIYPRTLRNHGIATSFANPASYRDSAGNPVPDCNVQNTGNCDIWDTAHGMIVPREVNGVYVLHTVVGSWSDPGDHYSKYARTCAAPDDVLPQGMTTAEMNNVQTALVGHELGHALQLEHRSDPMTDCHSILYDNMLAGTARRTWADMLPITLTYEDLIDAMRLWQ